MTDSVPPRRKPELPLLNLRVEQAADLHPGLRRLTFSCDGGLPPYRPGQDLVFLLPVAPDTLGRRHYTIRSLLDDGCFTVDFVLHGQTPGPGFALSARPGTTVQARGPRGRTSLRDDTRSHLFLGDETAMPAILHMLETLPPVASGHAVIEVPGPEWHATSALPSNATVDWLHRDDQPAPSTLLTEHLTGFDRDLGDVSLYLLAETGVVRAMRHMLLDRGVSKERIVSEGYWRPGRIGGHDHV